MCYVDGKKPVFEAGGPTWRAQLDAPQFFSDLDPGRLAHTHPDFGYADTINFKHNDIWTLLYDHIAKVPKYERLKNVILHLAQEKAILDKKKKLTWVADSDQNPSQQVPTLDKDG